MKIVRLEQALNSVHAVNAEISYRNVCATPQFTSGVIVFRPGRSAGRKQITHADKDVLCHIIRGRGRLRVRKRRFALARGTICHIPRGTPHDFAADGRAALVMFYSLIESGKSTGGRANR